MYSDSFINILHPTDTCGAVNTGYTGKVEEKGWLRLLEGTIYRVSQWKEGRLSRRVYIGGGNEAERRLRSKGGCGGEGEGVIGGKGGRGG